MLRIAVLITCHNQRDETLACLSALRQQIKEPCFSLTIYLVGDGSIDGASEAVASHANIQIFHGNGKVFWARGIHTAFAAAMKDHYDGYLWLSVDVVLDSDALARMLKTYQRMKVDGREHIIIVGSTRDQLSGMVVFGGLNSSNRLMPLSFKRIGPGEREKEIETMEGNFVYIPDETARLVGNIDTEFLQWGDADYGLRARRAGVRIWLMRGTIGHSRSNPARLGPRAPGIGVRARWKGPNGLSWAQWSRFAKRHGGPFWVFSACSCLKGAVSYSQATGLLLAWAIDGFRCHASTAVARLLLRAKGVIVGKDVKFDGIPIVSGCEHGQIWIGDRAVLVGCSRGTALGVRSPVILRVLAPGAGLRIGADSGLSGTVICAANSVEIGERVLIGADVMIFDTDFHNPEPKGRRHARADWMRISKPVVIGNDVFIGTRSIVMKGVSIGEGSIIGAGSVVTSSIPPFKIAAGSPARVLADVPQT
jgi:acetyltransferase-like isoleucine patch superfamily enzyme